VSSAVFDPIRVLAVIAAALLVAGIAFEVGHATRTKKKESAASTPTTVKPGVLGSQITAPEETTTTAAPAETTTTVAATATTAAPAASGTATTAAPRPSRTPRAPAWARACMPSSFARSQVSSARRGSSRLAGREETE